MVASSVPKTRLVLHHGTAAIVIATLALACAGPPPAILPPAKDGPVAVAGASRSDVTPSYVAPNPRAVATAIATMEAHGDYSLRDRYLGDVQQKTGCAVHVRIAHLPTGDGLLARTNAAEISELTKQRLDNRVVAVAAVHLAPTAAITVTVGDEMVDVGMVSVIVATEACAAPDLLAQPTSPMRMA